MKIVKLYDVVYDIRALYRKANTPAQRALAGYITKAGLTQDTFFGGAFKLLCDVERCVDNGEIYMIQSYVERETEKKILYIAQCAMDGTFDSFAIRKADIDTILKALAEI
jgi:hypothetical protein